ncbi:acetyl-CoA C-acyltransferase [Parvularcula dongshanensis]|uniref:Acetyl-CoA C-acetyltransferase n=1 Tax=Parvularcula dongshanensis TaxID=1173995 RepID=A0A840I226_9PROT|nr:acetyl-CoA C-acyltransferase [Parvularcula dongshanensis]MBB4658341.1 acetyl-CoA C-acetyltransferase [Parvularcula dongshanensis]
MLLPSEDPIVLASIARTPIGGFQGELEALSAPQLGAKAIASAIRRAGLREEEVSEVLMGCVLSAGLGQAPARQAALGAGLPDSVPCTTVNKMCGSGMKTVMLGAQALCADPMAVIVAGGMESMTNAPYLLPKARGGMRLGHGKVVDSMFFDGLEDAYEGGLMGNFAEACASKYEFSRAEQDEYAIESLNRSLAASDGAFTDEIAPICVETKTGTVKVSKDEQPFKAKPERITQLKPAFKREGGTVTAANASSISDGAAAVVMMRASRAEALGIAPIARLTAMTSHAQAPAWFTTAPVGALKALMEETGLTKQKIDLFEVNEAFAVVPMAAMADLQIPHEKMNVHGGACALGHPIGASGTRILVTLVGALRRRGLRTGVAAICIGGGEATAVSLELVS